MTILKFRVICVVFLLLLVAVRCLVVVHQGSAMTELFAPLSQSFTIENRQHEITPSRVELDGVDVPIPLATPVRLPVVIDPCSEAAGRALCVDGQRLQITVSSTAALPAMVGDQRFYRLERSGDRLTVIPLTLEQALADLSFSQQLATYRGAVAPLDWLLDRVFNVLPRDFTAMSLVVLLLLIGAACRLCVWPAGVIQQRYRQIAIQLKPEADRLRKQYGFRGAVPHLQALYRRSGYSQWRVILLMVIAMVPTLAVMFALSHLMAIPAFSHVEIPLALWSAVAAATFALTLAADWPSISQGEYNTLAMVAGLLGAAAAIHSPVTVSLLGSMATAQFFQLIAQRRTSHETHESKPVLGRLD